MSDLLTLVTEPWDDYALIDCGDGRKYERFGPIRTVRPEPQAMWAPASKDWDAQAEFEAVTGPARVWLGARDRLVDLDDQRRLFAALAHARPDWTLTMMPESGHVVLPAPAVEAARDQLTTWLAA